MFVESKAPATYAPALSQLAQKRSSYEQYFIFPYTQGYVCLSI